MRFSFSRKLALAISFLAVGATSISLFFFYERTHDMLLEQMGNRLKDIGRTSLYLFNKEERDAIRRIRDQVEKSSLSSELLIPHIQAGDRVKAIPDEIAQPLMKEVDFQNLVSLLRKIKDSTRHKLEFYLSRDKSADKKDPPSIAYASILAVLPGAKERKVLRFIADADYDAPGDENPVGNLFGNNSEAIADAFFGEVQSDATFHLEEGQYLLSAAIPILDDDGKVLAVLALDYDASSEANQVRVLRNLCIATVAASFVLSILIAYLLARLLNRPVSLLRAGAERVKLRDYATQITVKSGDEFGLLADAFNAMVRDVKENAQGLEKLNTAFRRFVPKEFLEQLGQKNIVDIDLGDQVQRHMTVLFCDIRSFTTISESMSPRDNFDFINQYLGTVGPVIRQNGGFIDKYIGDAVMALFPKGPEGAVQAAIGMHKSLIKFNQDGHDVARPNVSIGVGLHSGNLMLGTVGEPERMEGTVISDAVNLASRLEGLTKEFGAPLIVSEQTFNELPRADQFHQRYLGKVEVKGKRQQVKIYEIIDAENEDTARRKIITKDDFEAGVRALEAKKPKRARKYFSRVLKLNKTDKAASMYRQRCLSIIEQASSNMPVHQAHNVRKVDAALIAERVKGKGKI